MHYNEMKYFGQYYLLFYLFYLEIIEFYYFNNKRETISKYA